MKVYGAVPPEFEEVYVIVPPKHTDGELAIILGESAGGCVIKKVCVTGQKVSASITCTVLTPAARPVAIELDCTPAKLVQV